ncbi:MAG TPA: hypothetical protein VJN94_15095 [Candidatus Binataceae bacterium]|nr:hypothetical protein [Candidatus Binataceae bacterium]
MSTIRQRQKRGLQRRVRVHHPPATPPGLEKLKGGGISIGLVEIKGPALVGCKIIGAAAVIPANIGVPVSGRGPIASGR